jgi:hypothetical protein
MWIAFATDSFFLLKVINHYKICTYTYAAYVWRERSGDFIVVEAIPRLHKNDVIDRCFTHAPTQDIL